MQDQQNYIEIDVHNKIMQGVRQKELQYKNKLIELQKQKQYQTNRANDFQQRFKEALLETGAGNEENLIQKLCQKQTEVNNLRMQLFELKKSNQAETIDSQNTNTAQTVMNEDIQNLIHQNEQMASTIEQLKNAAISAIVSKDEQIQQLNEKLAKSQEVYTLYQASLQKEDSLQKQIQKLREQFQEQQKLMNQKLYKERQKYIQKIQEFQANLQSEQVSKHKLLQKATHLADNLENKDKDIQFYQAKILQFQTYISNEKQRHNQEKNKIQAEIDNYKDQILFFTKQEKNYQTIISQYKMKQKQNKLMLDRHRDEIAQLKRKLTIKKRKANPKATSSQIYSSFEGISQKSTYYSSFYKPTQKPTNLGEIVELQETDILDNFIDLEERNQEYTNSLVGQQQPVKTTKKKQKSTEYELGTSTLPNNASKKNKSKQTINKQKKEQICSETNSAQNDVKQKVLLLQQRLVQVQKQSKSYKQKLQITKKRLDQNYLEVQKLNKELKSKTEEITSQRKALAELRSMNKKSQKQNQLKIQLQNYKQHVFKLENALLIQKLQNAQKDEFVKERRQRQTKSYQERIRTLTEDMKKSPKKKKGFFG